jgi:hypothetical protein
VLTHQKLQNTNKAQDEVFIKFQSSVRSLCILSN